MTIRKRANMTILSGVLTACVIILPAVFSSCSNAYSKVSDSFREVTEVIDGDTVVLSNGRTVRYLGIDTPEVRKRRAWGWEYAPEPYALDAKKMNSTMVMGKTVGLEFDHKREDKYGRLLAYVFNEDVMVNEELLRGGLAVFTLYPPNHKYTERLVEAQKTARRGKIGIWKDCPVISHEDADRYEGRIVTVKGVVRDIGAGKSAVYLNFEKDRKDYFSAVIWKNNITFFKNLTFPVPEGYLGKTVEITGKIKYDNGPQMVLYHPSQIKVVE